MKYDYGTVTFQHRSGPLLVALNEIQMVRAMPNANVGCFLYLKGRSDAVQILESWDVARDAIQEAMFAD